MAQGKEITVPKPPSRLKRWPIRKIMIILILIILYVFANQYFGFGPPYRMTPYYDCSFFTSCPEPTDSDWLQCLDENVTMECRVEDVPDVPINDYIDANKPEQGNVYFYLGKYTVERPLAIMPSNVEMKWLNVGDITVTHKCNEWRSIPGAYYAEFAEEDGYYYFKNSFAFVVEYPSQRSPPKTSRNLVSCHYIKMRI